MKNLESWRFSSFGLGRKWGKKCLVSKEKCLVLLLTSFQSKIRESAADCVFSVQLSVSCAPQRLETTVLVWQQKVKFTAEENQQCDLSVPVISWTMSACVLCLYTVNTPVSLKDVLSRSDRLCQILNNSSPIHAKIRPVMLLNESPKQINTFTLLRWLRSKVDLIGGWQRNGWLGADVGQM